MISVKTAMISGNAEAARFIPEEYQMTIHNDILLQTSIRYANISVAQKPLAGSSAYRNPVVQ
jgi:hypothetical protein